MAKISGEQKRLLLEIANSEGWPLVKSFLDNFVINVNQKMVGAKDEATLKELAYELKYGALALHALFREVDSIKEALDKKKGL